MPTILASTSLIFPLEVAKFAFFVVYVAATIGVVIGVYWEGEKFDKETQHRGWLLLVTSPAVDTLFTILIIGTDGWIGQIQRSQISEALNRAVNAETTLAEYRKQRYLTEGQKDRIARVTKEFPSVPFVAYMVPEQEPWTFVLDIASALRAGGWTWLSVPGGWQPMDGNPSEGLTIADHMVVVAPSELREQAEALKVALTDPAVLGMDDVRLTITPKASTMMVVAGSKRSGLQSPQRLPPVGDLSHENRNCATGYFCSTVRFLR